MARKIFALSLAVVILFMTGIGLTGCNVWESYEFSSLEELQAALPDDFYFFEFENIDFSENGEFFGMKKIQSSIPKEDWQFNRYEIYFNTVNPDNGQEHRFEITATFHMYPRSFVGKIYEYRTIDDLFCKLNYNDKKNELLLTFGIGSGGVERYFYYFIMSTSENILNEAEDTLNEKEVEYFLSICIPAIESRYKINQTTQQGENS